MLWNCIRFSFHAGDVGCADAFHIDQTKKENRLILSLLIFTLVAVLLVFAKMDAGGFNVLWRYFAWANQTIAVFAFAMITVYMMRQQQPFMMALLPGMFYMFVISSFLLNANIGFRLAWPVSYLLGGMFTLLYAGVVIYGTRKDEVKT